MARGPLPCPVCKKPRADVRAGVAPFCSARCKDVDLYRWFGGDYAIAGEPAYLEAAEAEGDDPLLH